MNQASYKNQNSKEQMQLLICLLLLLLLDDFIDRAETRVAQSRDPCPAESLDPDQTYFLRRPRTLNSERPCLDKDPLETSLPPCAAFSFPGSASSFRGASSPRSSISCSPASSGSSCSAGQCTSGRSSTRRCTSRGSGASRRQPRALRAPTGAGIVSGAFPFAQRAQ